MNIESKKLWDEQYAAGKWTYLEDPAEKSRHAIISLYSKHLKPFGKILDVGCGECILMDFLDIEQMLKYTGIDISEEAVMLARKKRKANALVADAVDFVTSEKFDVIIFNEVIYYLDFPEIFEKYEALLADDGYVIISIYSAQHYLWRIPWMYFHLKIRRESRKWFTPIESMQLKGKSNEKKMTWTIDILKKQQP